MWGHSRTLSRVEALGMVRMVRDVLFYSPIEITLIFNSLCTLFAFTLVKYYFKSFFLFHSCNIVSLYRSNSQVTFWGLSLIQSLFVGLQNR